MTGSDETAGAVSGAAAEGTGRPSLWARFKGQDWFKQVAVGLAVGLLTPLLLWGGAWAWDRVTAPSDAEAARAALSHLTVGMSVERFRDKLGTPYVTRRVDAGPRRWTESLWLSKLYAAQTLSDGSGSVALYSMTTRDQSVALRDPRFGAELGRSHFTDYNQLRLDAHDVTSWKGRGTDWFYSEAHGLGAPGFETIVLTASSSGDESGYAKSGVPTDFPYVLCKRPLCSAPPNIIKDLSRLRNRLLVTTYTVVDPERLPLDTLPGEFRFGPDRDTMRGFLGASSRDS